MGAKHVVLTDMESVFDLLQHNVEQNKHLLQPQSTMVAKPLDWTLEKLPSLLSDEKEEFDLILAADCIYVHAPMQALIDVLKHYSTPGKTQILVSCEEHEPTSLQLFLKLAKKDFKINHIFEKKVEENQRVHVFELKR